jgi:adenylate kinase
MPLRAVISVTANRGRLAYIAPIMATQSKNNRSEWLIGPSAKCEKPDEIRSPWRLVLLGAPGVGKGTQADLLHQNLKACHLSTGDVFRAVGQNACALSPAMKTAMEFMRRGELVPDATVWEMVRERSSCLHCRGGFILDGFPRTLAQAEALKQLMDNEGLPLTAVVNYELPTSEVVSRLSGRRTCEQCRTVFHVIDRPPKNEGCCDRCGGKLMQREDDRPESIEVRLQAYDRSTAPLISFYQKLGLLMPLNAKGTPNEILEKTLEGLTLRRAAHPS